MTVVGPDDRGSTVLLEQGGTVEIRLPENASTGYVWAVVDAPGGLELVDDGVTLPGQLRPGAEGEHWFRFLAHPGARGAVELELRRPWDERADAAERFDVEIATVG